MIARTPSTVEEQPSENQPLGWQEELARTIRDPQRLLQLLELPSDLLEGAQRAAALFPLRVPHPYLQRIEKNNPSDPLLLQVLPLHAETLVTPGYLTDPLEERTATKTPGILHKYQGRALLIASGACAVNCRYCFRRHFPYQENNLSTEQWQQSLQYIAQDPTIDEVILSGGDPLAVNDKRFAWLVHQIESIAHVKRLRIHTRLPIVIPQRVNDALVDLLARSRLHKVMVIHANHPRELDDTVAHSLARLSRANVILLNQSVLLRGINDTSDVLEALSNRLFELKVLPYYLHLLDPVQGASHFDVSEAEGVHLIQRLTVRLPGYLVPKLVREEPGKPSKTAISAAIEPATL